MRPLTTAFGLAFALVLSARNARADDCEDKCPNKADCAATKSPNDDPAQFCLSTEGGPVPSKSHVRVLDDLITVFFKWDTKPTFPNFRGVEFSVILTDPLLEPFDVQDLNPTVGFDTNLPCPYRDVYNHTSGTIATVYAGLVVFCGMMPNPTTAMLAATLQAGISKASDTAWNFTVGSECPNEIEANQGYYFTYRTRRCEGTSCGGRAVPPATVSFAYIIQDGIPNSGFGVYPAWCPLVDGDSAGTFVSDWGDPKPPKWINRLCVPTKNVTFTPRSGNTCNGNTPTSLDCSLTHTECNDRDGDGKFDARTPAPIFGTARDCDDCDPSSAGAESTPGVCSDPAPAAYDAQTHTCDCIVGTTCSAPSPCAGKTGPYCAATLTGGVFELEELVWCSGDQVDTSKSVVCPVQCLVNPPDVNDVCCGDSYCDAAHLETASRCPQDCQSSTATCSDGIQNQGETGVDCGGPCAQCAQCADGAKRRCWVECVQQYAAGCIHGGVPPLIMGIETCAGGQWGSCATHQSCDANLVNSCANGSLSPSLIECTDGTTLQGEYGCSKALGCTTSYYGNWPVKDCPQDLCLTGDDACSVIDAKRSCTVHCNDPLGATRTGTQSCWSICGASPVWSPCLTDDGCLK